MSASSRSWRHKPRLSFWGGWQFRRGTTSPLVNGHNTGFTSSGYPFCGERRQHFQGNYCRTISSTVVAATKNPQRFKSSSSCYFCGGRPFVETEATVLCLQYTNQSPPAITSPVILLRCLFCSCASSCWGQNGVCFRISVNCLWRYRKCYSRQLRLQTFDPASWILLASSTLSTFVTARSDQML